MSTCQECTQWSLKGTDPKLARLAFAQCLRKFKGYTTSAHAQACDRFDQATHHTISERGAWLKKQDKGAA